MNILVIQTVLPEVELLLMNSGFIKIDGERWTSGKDEVAKLVPTIETILLRNKLQFVDVGKILVVNGIGGFSSTRIGVTIANVLAMALKAELYEITWPAVLENSQEALLELTKKFFAGQPEKVLVAKPVYSSEPMISESKKKKFT